MSIHAQDLVWFYSGGANNLDPARCLGGPPSAFRLLSASWNSLFPPLRHKERQLGVAMYRCLYIANTSPDSPLYHATVWMSLESGATGELSLGLDPNLPENVERLTDETQAPSGIEFQPRLGAQVALPLGNLMPGQRRAIWFRRQPVESNIEWYMGAVVVSGTSE